MTISIRQVLVLLFHHLASGSAGALNARQTSGSRDQPFISRPDLSPPKYTVSQINASAISPGYWFVAPFRDAEAATVLQDISACKFGPHIYSNDGQLVWSGASRFGNSKFIDFNVVEYDSTQYLTAVRSDLTVQDGPGLVLNSSYGVVQHISPGENASVANTKNFILSNKGAQALFLTSFDEEVDDALQTNDGVAGPKARDDGIRQIEVKRGLVLHEWKFLEFLDTSDSFRPAPQWSSTDDWSEWDWMHASSLQELSEPLRFLVSGRFTNTIYKISLEPDTIVWRLGGPHSSFTCDGFNFSRQNEAKVLSEDSDRIVLTVFNNAADDLESFAEYSAGYLIEVDTDTLRATLLREFPRPDRGLSRFGGNMQQLENGNMFVSWGDRGYITEFDEEGRPILEASWADPDLNTHRAYKFNFVGYSTEPIALKCFADAGKTNCFVSWNGATEVHSWEFWQLAEQGEKHSLGTARKDGFETVVSLDGLLRTVAVKALDAQGNLLGWSMATETVFSGEMHPDPIAAGQGAVQGVEPPQPQYEPVIVRYWSANSGWAWLVFAACLSSFVLILQKFYRFKPVTVRKKTVDASS